MKIAIDIDGCISAYPAHFRILTQVLKSNAELKIYIITSREQSRQSREKTIDELEKLGIEYDHLIITDNKADFIINNDISLFFDNEDENFKGLGPEVCCLKIREEMNYCFKSHRWYFDKYTGIYLPKK